MARARAGAGARARGRASPPSSARTSRAAPSAGTGAAASLVRRSADARRARFSASEGAITRDGFGASAGSVVGSGGLRASSGVERLALDGGLTRDGSPRTARSSGAESGASLVMGDPLSISNSNFSS